MRIQWVSKDNGTYHYYAGAVSICRQENLTEPFAKKYNRPVA